ERTLAKGIRLRTDTCHRCQSVSLCARRSVISYERRTLARAEQPKIEIKQRAVIRRSAVHKGVCRENEEARNQRVGARETVVTCINKVRGVAFDHRRVFLEW